MSFRSAPNAEEQLLIAALRHPSDTLRLPERIDAERLSILTDRHRVAGLLENLLDTSSTGATPPSWVASFLVHLRARRDTNAEAFLDQLCTLVAVRRVLEELGAEHLVLKGPALVRLYRNETDRHAGDLDILLRHARTAERVTDALLADGWRAENGWEERTRRWRTAYMKERKDLSLSRGRGFTRLELHWRPFKTGPSPRHDPFTTAVPRRAGGQSFLGLGDIDEAAYLLQHGTVHGWARLKWLADIVRVEAALNPAAANAARRQAFSDERHDAIHLIDGLLSGFGGDPPRSDDGATAADRAFRAGQRMLVATMMDTPTPPKFFSRPFRPSFAFRSARFLLAASLAPQGSNRVKMLVAGLSRHARAAACRLVGSARHHYRRH